MAFSGYHPCRRARGHALQDPDSAFGAIPGYEQWRIPKIVRSAGRTAVVGLVAVVDRRARRKLSARLCVVISSSPYLDKLVLFTSHVLNMVIPDGGDASTFSHYFECNLS